MSSFWKDIEILYLDHISIVASDFDQAVNDYLNLPGCRLLRGPGVNKTQQVRYAFVQQDVGIVWEILSPCSDASPISKHQQGPYHLCFAVQNLERSIQIAQKAKAHVIVEPVPDCAFDGRRIAFLSHPYHGVFELVEAFPSSGTETKLSAPEADTSAPAVDLQKEGSVQQRLIKVICKQFTALDDASAIQAAYGQPSEWDSLAHLNLLMTVEQEFEISLSTDAIMKALDFQKILSLVQSHLQNS